MPLDPVLLSSQLRNALLADAATQALDNAALTAVCDAIAQAVLFHIVANAVVLPTLMVAPPGGSGGPVTGTGVIT